MSVISLKLERYNEGADFLRKAKALYVRGGEAVEIKRSEAIMRTSNNGNKPFDNNESQTSDSLSCYTNAEDDESMCLDAMILETLKSRANFHIKYLDDMEQAVDCHEQCLARLIHLNKLHCWDEMEEPVREQGVAFVQLSKEQHTVMLMKSLESLSGVYRVLAAGSTFTSCMSVFEDALDILQNRQEQEEPNNDALILSVAQILRYLSEIYFERRELERAVDALHDSTAVKLTASGEPCLEALEVMDQMGAANEQMNNWEKALSCYQQTLFARSKYYGNTHFCVAKSLANVARVMERKDGITEESVELNKAANAMFALQISSDSPDLGEDVEAILELIPTALCRGLYEKTVTDLNMCLVVAEDKNSGLTLDKAQIYFDLARAYMGMKNYEMATTSIMNAVKEFGNVNDDDVFKLLRHVEFLQRNPSPNVDTSIHSIHQRDIVQDPKLSFQDVSLWLQGEPSMHIFDDDTSTGGNPICILTEKKKTELEVRQSNPQYDILYQSFTQETMPRIPAATKAAKDKRVSLVRAFRARFLPPSRNQGNTGKTAAHSQLRVKLAKKVAKIIKRLKEPQSQPRKTARYKLSTQKLESARAKCFKMCQGKSKSTSKSTWSFVHREVTIQEEEGGFASNVKEVLIEEVEDGFTSHLVRP